MNLTSEERELVISKLKPLDINLFDNYLNEKGVKCKIPGINKEYLPSEVLKNIDYELYEEEQVRYFNWTLDAVLIGLDFYNRQEIEILLEERNNLGIFCEELNWENLYYFYIKFCEEPPAKFRIQELINISKNTLQNQNTRRSEIFVYIRKYFSNHYIESFYQKGYGEINFIRGKDEDFIFGFDFGVNKYWIGSLSGWERIKNDR